MKNKHTCKFWKEKCTIGYECCPNDWDETECDNYKIKVKKKDMKINTSTGEMIVHTVKINHVCKPKTLKKK